MVCIIVVAKFSQGIVFNLADAFTANSEPGSYLVQSHRFAVGQAVAQLYYLP